MAKCRQCGAQLSRYNPGTLCAPCQRKRAEEQAALEDSYYDAEQMAVILGSKSAESVKRLSRKNKIPGRIPGIKKHLFLKQVVDEWIKSDHQVSLLTKKEVETIKAMIKARELHWDINLFSLDEGDPYNLINAVKMEEHLTENGDSHLL